MKLHLFLDIKMESVQFSLLWPPCVDLVSGPAAAILHLTLNTNAQLENYLGAIG